MSIQRSKTPRIELPVAAVRNVLEFLPAKDQGACAVVSQRMKMIADYDPSADLEKMQSRKAITASPIKPPSASIPGPSYKFLFSNPESLEEQHKIRLIQLKMKNNRNVQKSVFDITKLESYCTTQFIPLYHATNVPTFALSFLTRALLSSPYLPFERLPCSAPFIRFPTPDGPKTIKELFEKYPLSIDEEKPYDKIPGVQKELLSLTLPRKNGP